MLAKAKGGKSRNKKKKTRNDDDQDEEDESSSTTNPQTLSTTANIGPPNEKYEMSNTMKIVLLVIGVLLFIGGCIKAYSMMFWTAPTKTATEKQIMREKAEEIKKKEETR